MEPASLTGWIALYAAVVASLALGWNVLSWRKGKRPDVTLPAGDRARVEASSRDTHWPAGLLLVYCSAAIVFTGLFLDWHRRANPVDEQSTLAGAATPAASSPSEWARSPPPAGGSNAPSPALAGLRAGKLPYCGIDKIDGSTIAGGRAVASAGRVAITGWIIDGQHAALVADPHVLLMQHGRRVYAAALSPLITRHDVAAALGDKALARCGFNTSLDLRAVPGGTYEVVLATSASPEAALCNQGVRLEVAR